MMLATAKRVMAITTCVTVVLTAVALRNYFFWMRKFNFKFSDAQ